MDAGDGANAAANAAAPDAPAEANVAAVNFKLPAFWANDPQVWFVQAEAYFATHNVRSSKTKYQVVVSSLSPQYAVEIRDLLLAPPADTPYEKLKEALTTRTQRSEQAYLRELLSNEELGDQEPSKLLRRMQQLLGDKQLDGSLLRELFVSRLPPPVHMILSSAPDAISVDDLAKMADKVVESTKPAIIHHVAPKENDTSLSRLEEQLTKLIAAVSALTMDSRRPQTQGSDSRGRSRSRSRRRDRSTSPSEQESGVCYYHRKFGGKARRCTKPCSYEPQQSGNATASQ